MSAPRTFLFLGGGSGGHIYPGLAIAEQLSELSGTPPRRVFVTSTRALDNEIMAAAIARGDADAHETIAAQPFSPRPLKLLRCMGSWGRSVRAVRALIRAERAHDRELQAVSLAGFVAAPAAQACRAEKVPLAAVQLDAARGLANTLIAARADRLFAVNKAPDGRGWRVVPPLVRTVAIPTRTPEQARTSLGLDPDRPTLLVFGGSQGAGTLNRLIPELVRTRPGILDARRWQILHIAGPGRDAEIRGLYGRALGERAADAVVLPSLHRMGDAWAAAELAIGRGGAGTLAEAQVSRTRIVVFPYPFHRDRHQARNARPLEEAGLAIILDDKVDVAANLHAHADQLAALLQAGPESGRLPLDRAKSQTRENGARVIAEALLA